MQKTLDRARQLWRADRSAAPLDGGLLAALFGLTPAEQRVAVRLAQGWDANEIADALQVQANTVRSHIKQLLAKSDTRRQAEFVARVWHTAMRLERSSPSTHPASAGADVPFAPHLTHLGKDSQITAPETQPQDQACNAGIATLPMESST